MASQDLDLAAAARVAVEGALYCGRYRADADSLATPQLDPRSRRGVPARRGGVSGSGPIIHSITRGDAISIETGVDGANRRGLPTLQK